MYESNFRSFKGLFNYGVSRSSNTYNSDIYIKYDRYYMFRHDGTRDSNSSDNSSNDICRSRHYRRMDL